MPSISPARLSALLEHLPRTRPAYRWLASGVRSGIESGVIAPGAALPGERTLADALGLGRITISHAYALLAEEGFANARPGSGTRAAVPDIGTASREPMPLVATEMKGGELDLASAGPLPHPAVLPALRGAPEAAGRYIGSSGYFPAGVPELRRAIASAYTRGGLPTREAEIFVTSGSMAGLVAVLSTELPRGRAVVTDSPSFPNALVAIRAEGGRPVGVPLGGHGTDVPRMAAEIRRSRAPLAYVMPDFHNPTGLRMGEAAREELAAAADACGTRLICDDTTASTGLEPEAHAGPSIARRSRRAILLGSTSKSLWAGLRVGWIRADAATIEKIGKSRTVYDAALLEQLAVASILDAGTLDSGSCAGSRPQLLEQRDLVVDALRRLCPEWDVPRPEGGLSLWCRLPAPVSSALVTEAARERIRLLPARAFSPTGRGLEDHIRVPFTLPVGDLREALERLGRAWRTVRASA